MNSRKKIIVLVICFSLFFLSVGNPVGAQFSKGGPGWNIGNIAEFGLPSASVDSIVANVASWLLKVFVFFGIIGFVVSGIMYLVSAGNDEMITKAKRYMLYSIVGVIVGLSGYVIIWAVYTMLNASPYF